MLVTGRPRKRRRYGKIIPIDHGLSSIFMILQVLTINVKPGWKSGTKITFQREGDQAPNKIPADIVFIIRDKPHVHFRREGPDLKYSCKISLKEVLT